MEAPIVLCGLGRMGTRILEYLHAANLPVVVIDNRCRPDDPRLMGVRLVPGDCRQRSVLEAAGVASARGVLILTNDVDLHRLRGGDRLVGIITLPDLERLLRRQQPPAVFAVEVLGFPLPARDWLAALFRTQRHCTEEEANHALEQLPLLFSEHLTRGQAEDLLAQLARERIDAKLLSR